MARRKGWRAWRRRKQGKPPELIVEKRKPRTTCAYIDTGMHWYVAYVRPMSEKSVARKLESDGLTSRDIITYLPVVTYDVDKQHHGRRTTTEVERALFASYLFVGMEAPELQFGAVRDMDGVIDLLSDADQEPVEIPASLLRQIERGLSDPPPPRHVLTMAAGCLIRITEGPFSSFLGVVQEIVAQNSVHVLLQAFGRETVAQLQFSQLEAA